MAQQSLYRRYRPRRFGEVRGQDHVTRALLNAVANESEGHAYLFSGPRGTGKTSTARILAKALNCERPVDGEPCCECEPCLAIEAGRSFDLFELDAASNNGVDSVRDLVERSVVASPGRTKVYILDEVHMLTAAASNALLKTLEEPPEHVRFVLATTDPQKVLPTIRSRTQHYEFQLLSAEELERYVRFIVEDAGLEVDDEAVAHVVRQGRGSARDTLSALDQVVAAGGVLLRSEPVDQLFAALAANDTGAAVLTVAEALAQGHDPRVLGEAFLGAVRDAFLLSLGVETPHLVEADRTRLGEWADQLGTAGLTRAMERVGVALVDMRQAADPRVPLEVALVQITSAPAALPAEGASRPQAGPEGAADSAALAEIRSRLDALESESKRAGAAPRTSSPTSADPAPAKDSKPDEGPQPAKGSAQAKGSQPAGQAAPTRSAPPQPPRRTPPAAAPSPAPAPAAPETQSADRAPADTAAAVPDTAAASAVNVAPSASTSAPADAPSAPASGGLPERDAIVMAFGDSVVPNLKGIAKAIYSGGRFVAVSDGAAVFSLDNAPTRDRAEKYRPQVEEMLGAHFGSPVPLRLVIESEVASRPAGNASSDPGVSAPSSASPGGAATAGASAPSRGATGQADSSRSRGNPASSGGDAREGAPAGSDSARATSTGPSGARSSAGSADDRSPADTPDVEESEAELAAAVHQLPDADVVTSGVDRLTAAFPGAELIQNDDGAPT